MDNLKNNIITEGLMLLGNLFGYLKKLVMVGFPFKRELIESIDFLRTLENIHGLGGRMAQGELLEEGHGTEKNLLACAVSEEAQVLFFNISGSEFIELYVSPGVAGIRELWNKAVLFAGRFGHQVIVDRPGV
ncbi:MAG: hypothetical protein EPN17_12995 [Methylobacter sp.]|nr:MAG: hypothetical protein EPN17_12995 [Methylobacter sp.]